MEKKTVLKRAAFTIVELLTVMSVIALLIGLLVPALTLVRDYARELQQRAQFHSIEVGIDMFVSESGHGDYPPSNENSLIPADPLGQDYYGGAQKLAEAMVGWDLLGFHPDSSFRSDGRGMDATGTVVDIYPQPGVVPTRAQLDARVGPFLDLENANAFRLGEIWPAANLGNLNPNNYVLCDVYAKRRHLGQKTGMPILYFRARTEWYDQSYDAGNQIDDDIYYYRDNELLMLLGTPDQPPVLHPLADTGGNQNDWLDFENMILNPQIPTATLRRPYRAKSYILISAGKDGLYGTGDDITNFDQKE